MRRSRTFWPRLRSSRGGSAAFCMDVETDEGSESHGIHVGEVGEIEDDALMGGHELGDGSVEEVGVPGEQFSVAADEGGGSAVFHLQVEGWGGGLGHRHAPSGNLFYRSRLEEGAMILRLVFGGARSV